MIDCFQFRFNFAFNFNLRRYTWDTIKERTGVMSVFSKLQGLKQTPVYQKGEEVGRGHSAPSGISSVSQHSLLLSQHSLLLRLSLCTGAFRSGFKQRYGARTHSPLPLPPPLVVHPHTLAASSTSSSHNTPVHSRRLLCLLS